MDKKIYELISNNMSDPIMERKTCSQSGSTFAIYTSDRKFFQKIAISMGGQNIIIPYPTLSPEERHRRRMSARNERKLYKRSCDATGKSIISVYSPNKPYKVYDHHIRRGDTRDAIDYGQDFDFTKSFFQQRQALQLQVPRMSMIITTCENCDYAPYSVNSKNCYMCVSIVGSENILYSYQTNASENCVDCSLSYKCRECYECIYGVNLYNCHRTRHCEDSTDLYFCRDCISCSYCIGCVNLENKKYHIFNQPVTIDVYKKYVEELSTHRGAQKIEQEYIDLMHKTPSTRSYNINCENCTGNYLLNCKNCKHCFEAEGLEDCSYIYVLPQGAKDCYDVQYAPRSERCYEGMSVVDDYQCHFGIHGWNNKHCIYFEECYDSSFLFGCIGLKNKAYCILNKQYTRAEYEVLVPKIVKHMQSTGERGEFFPANISPFGYNESMAMDLYPLDKEEVIKKGRQRNDEEYHINVPDNAVGIEAKNLPEDIADTNDTILDKIIICQESGKPYRIIKSELQFYRQHKLALPRIHPEIRHTKRIQGRKSIYNNCYNTII